ncbi:MAG TPA: hypothetical protein VG963_14550, partial [Polyangiaceae bacterium]|nr:hypothetical protein [Polyangiaceae bacterium]
MSLVVTAPWGCFSFQPGTDTLESVGTGTNSLTPAPLGEDWKCLDQPAQFSSAPVFAGAAPQVIFRMQMV